MSRTKYQWGYEVDDPVLNHPILQIQADHKQLGQVSYVLPQAKHSRFNHFGFAKYIADRICNDLEKRENSGRIQRRELLCGFKGVFVERRFLLLVRRS